MADKRIPLSKYRAISASFFKDKVYVHFNQVDGKKSFTLSGAEFTVLCRKWPQIMRMVRNAAKEGQKPSKKKAVIPKQADFNFPQYDHSQDDEGYFESSEATQPKCYNYSSDDENEQDIATY